MPPTRPACPAETRRPADPALARLLAELQALAAILPPAPPPPRRPT